MTEAEIRELLALETRATPGPWEFNSYSTVQARERDICSVPTEDGYGDQSTGQDNNNGWLIAAARNAIRPLAEEVLRQRARIAELSEEES